MRLILAAFLLLLTASNIVSVLAEHLKEFERLSAGTVISETSGNSIVKSSQLARAVDYSKKII